MKESEKIQYTYESPYSGESYGDRRLAAEYREKEGTGYLTFPLFDSYSFVGHGFSSRIGGASEGDFATMNLSYTRGDDPARVTCNYKRIGKALGFTKEQLVLSDQIHETNVVYVTKKDCQGESFYKKKLVGVDGLITDEKQVVLATSYADCVPLFFVDPEHEAIGSAHAGWRWTVGEIGRKTICRMGEQFGSRPEELRVVIGPSICVSCYEVSEEVAEAFCAILPEEQIKKILWKKDNGKYQLDLWMANRLILENSGVLPEHIATADVCTCCNPTLLFSHRYTKGKRGNLNGFLWLK